MNTPNTHKMRFIFFITMFLFNSYFTFSQNSDNKFFILFTKVEMNRFICKNVSKKYQISYFNNKDTIELQNNNFNKIYYPLNNFGLIIKKKNVVVKLDSLEKYLVSPFSIKNDSLFMYIGIAPNKNASIGITRINNCYDTGKVIKKGKGLHTFFISDIKK